jgi:hypothetical protein
MPPDKEFQPDLTTAARFYQARTAVNRGEVVVLLDFTLLDCEPSPTTAALECSLDDTRKLIHTCLAALASCGDQHASVLLKVLRESVADAQPG